MGTYLRVLSESYPMNNNMTGIRWFSKKKDCVLLLWVNVASSLQGLNDFNSIQNFASYLVCLSILTCLRE